MTKKRPRFGAIPKVNMPRKSHTTPKPQPRARQSRHVIVEETQQTNQHCYKGLLDFSQRLTRIKSLTQWNTKTLEDKVGLKNMADPYVWYMCGKTCLLFPCRKRVRSYSTYLLLPDNLKSGLLIFHSLMTKLISLGL